MAELLGEPRTVLKRQSWRAHTILEEVNVLAELVDGIQGYALEERQLTELCPWKNAETRHSFTHVLPEIIHLPHSS